MIMSELEVTVEMVFQVCSTFFSAQASRADEVAPVKNRAPQDKALETVERGEWCLYFEEASDSDIPFVTEYGCLDRWHVFPNVM